MERSRREAVSDVRQVPDEVEPRRQGRLVGDEGSRRAGPDGDPEDCQRVGDHAAPAWGTHRRCVSARGPPEQSRNYPPVDDRRPTRRADRRRPRRGCRHAAVLAWDLFRKLAVPIDRGITIGDHWLFGPNKTWRGVVVMTCGTAIGAALLFPITPPAPLGTVERAVAGALMGLSYTLAELPNSFVKRRLGIAPGEVTGRVQELADLADSVLGVTLAVTLLFDLTFANFLSLLAAGTVLHLVVDRLLHAIGVKSVARRRA